MQQVPLRQNTDEVAAAALTRQGIAVVAVFNTLTGAMRNAQQPERSNIQSDILQSRAVGNGTRTTPFRHHNPDGPVWSCLRRANYRRAFVSCLPRGYHLRPIYCYTGLTQPIRLLAWDSNCEHPRLLPRIKV
jgi:hypothetical protein